MSSMSSRCLRRISCFCLALQATTIGIALDQRRCSTGGIIFIARALKDNQQWWKWKWKSKWSCTRLGGAKHSTTLLTKYFYLYVAPSPKAIEGVHADSKMPDYQLPVISHQTIRHMPRH